MERYPKLSIFTAFVAGILLSLGFKDFYRVRVGQYRIIYNIFDNILTVSVVEVMTRSTGYK